MTGKGVAAKEGHEGGSKGTKTLIKRFQGRFPTHRISDEHDEKVNRVIEAKSGTGKPHPLLDAIQHAKLSKHMGNNGNLTKPRGRTGNRLGSNLDVHRRMRHTGCVSS